MKIPSTFLLMSYLKSITEELQMAKLLFFFLSLNMLRSITVTNTDIDLNSSKVSRVTALWFSPSSHILVSKTRVTS